jgi:hypothetical protein
MVAALVAVMLLVAWWAWPSSISSTSRLSTVSSGHRHSTTSSATCATQSPPTPSLPVVDAECLPFHDKAKRDVASFGPWTLERMQRSADNAQKQYKKFSMMRFVNNTMYFHTTSHDPVRHCELHAQIFTGIIFRASQFGPIPSTFEFPRSWEDLSHLNRERLPFLCPATAESRAAPCISVPYYWGWERDYAQIMRGYAEFKASGEPRIPRCFFRGSKTNAWRQVLVDKALEIDTRRNVSGKSTLFDAKWYVAETGENYVPKHLQARQQCLLCMDGYGYPNRFFTELLTGAVVVKQNTAEKEWFDEWVQPGVHYIPLDRHLHTLEETAEWVLDPHNAEFLQRMTDRAHDFVQQNLRPRQLFCYIRRLLHEIAEALEYDPSTLPLTDYRPVARFEGTRAFWYPDLPWNAETMDSLFLNGVGQDVPQTWRLGPDDPL